MYSIDGSPSNFLLDPTSTIPFVSYLFSIARASYHSNVHIVLFQIILVLGVLAALFYQWPVNTIIGSLVIWILHEQSKTNEQIRQKIEENNDLKLKLSKSNDELELLRSESKNLRSPLENYKHEVQQRAAKLEKNHSEQIRQKIEENNDLKLKLGKSHGKIEISKSECKNLMRNLKNYENGVKQRNSKSWPELLKDWAPTIAKFGLSYVTNRTVAGGFFALK